MAPSNSNSRTTTLNALQLRDVQDVLRKPLTGRSVLIPLGSKAFVAGQLQPLLNEQQEELIKLRSNTTDELQQDYSISRTKAIDMIQQEIKDLLPKKKKPPISKSPPVSSSSKSAPPAKADAAAAKNGGTLDGNPNFFEIREEIDDHGQVVHSEKVNITNHLKLWEKEVQKASSSPNDNDNDNDDTSPEVAIKGANSGGHTVSGTPLESESLSEIVEEQEEVKRDLSEEQYAALTSRLDELALLEEQDGQKTENKKSAKKLQSKGWSNGFLNNNHPSKPKEKRKTAVAVGDGDESGKPKTKDGADDDDDEGSVNTVEHSNVAASITQRDNDMGSSSSNRTVGFSNEKNTVREIPRVGQRSVSEIKKPVTTPPPIQDNLFSNAVRERPRSNRAKTQTATSTQHGNNDPASQQQQQPQRKVSRFAQQRSGQKGWRY